MRWGFNKRINDCDTNANVPSATANTNTGMSRGNESETMTPAAVSVTIVNVSRVIAPDPVVDQLPGGEKTKSLAFVSSSS